jgi:hypothetical protein
MTRMTRSGHRSGDRHPFLNRTCPASRRISSPLRKLPRKFSDIAIPLLLQRSGFRAYQLNRIPASDYLVSLSFAERDAFLCTFDLVDLFLLSSASLLAFPISVSSSGVGLAISGSIGVAGRSGGFDISIFLLQINISAIWQSARSCRCHRRLQIKIRPCRPRHQRGDPRLPHPKGRSPS